MHLLGSLNQESMHDNVENFNRQQALLELNLPTLSLTSQFSVVVPAAAASPVCH